MKKLLRALVPICILGLLAAALLLPGDTLPGWEVPEGLTASQQRRIVSEITRAAALYREACPSANSLTREDMDAIEARLLEAGLTAIDSDGVYPSHLGNPDSLYRFWDAAASGKAARQSVLRVNEDGGFSHLFFVHGTDEDFFVDTMVGWDSDGKLYVRECNVLPIYDMELADWGIFYFRIYPANDPHYVDYGQFRLTPVDRELYDLTRKYILPVGYQMVNLFLCDWQEGDWGSLSFNDLLDPLYTLETGQLLPWEAYPFYPDPSRAMIPARLFEDTVLPYFQISLEEFRKLCRYDSSEDAYPWRPIYGDDLTGWKYPMCEPEVLGYTQNADGTLTLEVQVYSPEIKTNRLFAHELTVRPLPDGTFQYVANQVTFTGQRGLPPAMARFQLDGGWK